MSHDHEITNPSSDLPMATTTSTNTFVRDTINNSGVSFYRYSVRTMANTINDSDKRKMP